MTKEDYYDYGKKVGTEFNKVLEDNFENLKNYNFPEGKVKMLKLKESLTDEQIKDELLKYKKGAVSDMQNAIEDKETLNYQLEKSLITKAKYDKEVIDIDKKLRDAVRSIKPIPK
jgi:superfamily I DNA and/or RNA helicase